MPLAEKDSRGEDFAEQAYLIEFSPKVTGAKFDEIEGLDRLDMASEELTARGAEDVFRSKTRGIAGRLNRPRDEIHAGT